MPFKTQRFAVLQNSVAVADRNNGQLGGKHKDKNQYWAWEWSLHTFDRNTDFSGTATTLKAPHTSECCAKDIITKTIVIKYLK